MENNRIIIKALSSEIAENEDVKEFYLGISKEGKKNFRDVKNYRRRKRWLT